MRLAEHAFIRDFEPMELRACRHCGMPEDFCACDPEQEELPAYAGSDPELYLKEKH